jgi:phage terminase small subunit
VKDHSRAKEIVPKMSRFPPKNARTGASKLVRQYSNILQRRDELLSQREQIRTKAVVVAEQKVGITKERVLEELWDNAMKAKAAVPVRDREGNETGEFVATWSASNQALQLVGKEMGMFIDRKESGGAGAFANLPTDPKEQEELLKRIDEERAARAAKARLVVVK